MPKLTEKALTPSQVANAKPKDAAYRITDGRGMFLLVQPNGAKWWRFKYNRPGTKKQNLLSLGVYPDVSLKQARERREAARKLLADGIDPGDQRKTEALAGADTFEAIGREWFNTKLKDKSKGHKVRAKRLLERELIPFIGSRPIKNVSAPDLLAALRRIESRGAVATAHRARQTASQVFAYAIQTGRAERNPANDLIGALEPRQKQHLAAVTEPKVLGKLLRDMDGSRAGPIVKTALLLSPMLFQRPGELRAMEWAEINWDERRWEIPAEKMKMRLPHIVPLPEQALTLLRGLQRFTGRGRYVFPSARGASRSLSENGVRIALRDLGWENGTITPHGFRATARTILDEVLGFRVDYIEHQLAHAVKDANGRAYNRTSHLEGRTKMMQSWADYLDALKRGADVIPIHRKA